RGVGGDVPGVPDQHELHRDEDERERHRNGDGRFQRGEAALTGGVHASPPSSHRGGRDGHRGYCRFVWLAFALPLLIRMVAMMIAAAITMAAPATHSSTVNPSSPLLSRSVRSRSTAHQ